jgi:hypothetical protein
MQRYLAADARPHARHGAGACSARRRHRRRACRADAVRRPASRASAPRGIYGACEEVFDFGRLRPLSGNSPDPPFAHQPAREARSTRHGGLGRSCGPRVVEPRRMSETWQLGEQGRCKARRCHEPAVHDRLRMLWVALLALFEHPRRRRWPRPAPPPRRRRWSAGWIGLELTHVIS